jgi:hypothetical protein
MLPLHALPSLSILHHDVQMATYGMVGGLGV